MQYILVRRVFHRIQDDTLELVDRTMASSSSMYRVATQRHSSVKLSMSFDRSPCSADDRWFVYISVLGFDCIALGNLHASAILREFVIY